VTLKTRRRTYWALFGISLSQFLLGLTCLSVLLASRNPAVFLIEHGIYKVYKVFGFRLPSQMLSAFDSICLAAFAVVASGSILRSFRKTVSAEIFCFSFWLATLSFEPLRVLHFVLALNGETDSLLGAFDKLYLGIKIFGYICLFISGLYAAGMRSERQFSIVLVAAAASGFLAMALPINTGIWTGNLMFKAGYGSLITGFTTVVILITIVDYLIAVRARGDRAFYYIAAGMAAVSVGAFFLCRDVSPAMSVASLLALAGGGILSINRLHSFYLWQ
jgi:hypothetical protein